MSSEQLKFYHFIVSGPSRAVLALLKIGNIPHQLVTTNLMKGQTRTQQYLKHFPLGHLPAISLGDFHLAQCSAILSFLCDKYPTLVPSHLYPQDLAKRAKVNEMLSWNSAEFRPTVNEPVILRFRQMFLGEPFTAAQLEQSEKKTKAILDLLDRVIVHNGGFVAGKEITIADLVVYFELCVLMVFKKEWTKWKNVDAWFKKVYAVPQVKQVTHEWSPTIEKTAELLNSIKPMQAKL